MKVGNYIINIFTALPSKIPICVLSKILGEHTHTEMSNALSLYNLEHISSACVKVNVSLLCANGNH